MPRSLAQAGVNEVPYFVKSEHVDNQPFYIENATARVNRWNNEQVVLKLRLGVGVYDFEGTLHKKVWVSMPLGTSGQRRDMVKYFQRESDPIGPCFFTPVPTDNGNDFIRIDDITPEEARAMLVAGVEPRQIGARTPAQSDDGMQEDLPF